MAGPWEKLQQFGNQAKRKAIGAYGAADQILAGVLPGGPVQSSRGTTMGQEHRRNQFRDLQETYGNNAERQDPSRGVDYQPGYTQHSIPLQAYIDKRMIKNDVLDTLKEDMEYFIRQGLEPEHAMNLIINNKKKQFSRTLNPNDAFYKAIQEGDTKSAQGKAAHQAANVFKYFEDASPKEYDDMFSSFGITDGNLVNNLFRMPNTGGAGPEKAGVRMGSRMTDEATPTFRLK